MNVEGGAVADAHPAEDDVPVVEFHHAQRHVAGQRRVVAQRQQVPAAGREIDSAGQVHVVADLRAQCPQRRRHRMRAGQRVPRDVSGDPRDDPQPHVQTAPGRRPAGTDAADQGARDRRGGQDGERCPQRLRRRHGHRRQPRDAGQADARVEPRDDAGDDHISQQRGDRQFAQEPCRLHGRRRQHAGGRRQRRRWCRAGRGDRRGSRNAGGQGRRGARLVDVASGQRGGVGPFAQARHQHAGPQRVAAEVAEEVVVHRHWRGSLQGRLHCRGDDGFEGRARLDVHARGPATGRVVETRQRRPISASCL